MNDHQLGYILISLVSLAVLISLFALVGGQSASSVFIPNSSYLGYILGHLAVLSIFVEQLAIRNLLSDFAVISDSGSISGEPDFSAFVRVFVDNVTYDFGGFPGVVHGLANVEDVFRKNYPPGTIMQNVVSMEHIELVSTRTATAISYDTNTYFGTGNLTGQIVVSYVRFNDTLVKTNLSENGGWRIATRSTKYFGHPEGIGNVNIRPPWVD